MIWHEESVPCSRISKRRLDNMPAWFNKRKDLWVTAEEEAALVARSQGEGHRPEPAHRCRKGPVQCCPLRGGGDAEGA